MFNIGLLEMIILGAITLVVVGPKNLPQLARMVGKGLREFKKTTNEFKTVVKQEMDQMAGEELEDLKKIQQNIGHLPRSINTEQFADFMEKTADIIENPKKEGSVSKTDSSKERPIHSNQSDSDISANTPSSQNKKQSS